MTNEGLTNWITDELAKKRQVDFEQLESLKFKEGEVTQFEVDFSKPFNTYTADDGKVKAIIPVTHNGQKMNLWLNKANPLYYQLLDRYSQAQQTVFNVIQTGSKEKTKYLILSRV